MPDRIHHILLRVCLGTALLAIGFAGVPSTGAIDLPENPGRVPSATPFQWQSAARWCHGVKKTSGTLTLAESGIEFAAARGPRFRWSFVEIRTFDLSPRCLKLTGYENRSWHRYGERSFSFDLASAVPPAIATELAECVAKPAANGAPDPTAPAFATLAARHRTRSGGTSGVLRFRDSGIDYVTGSGRGARSWRWADIQTLAYPDAFHFRVGAYREIFEFELKQPMPGELFDRLWNDLYARDLGVTGPKGGVRP